MSGMLAPPLESGFSHVEALGGAFEFLAQDALGGRSEPRARPLAVCRRVGRRWASAGGCPTAAARVVRQEAERATGRALARAHAAVPATTVQSLVDAMSAGVAAVLSAFDAGAPEEPRTDASLARALLEDDFVTEEDGAAPAYLVVAFAPTERARPALRELLAVPGVLVDGPLDNCRHALVPASDESVASESEPLRELAAQTWVGVRWGRTGELSQAREVADTVLELGIITNSAPAVRSLTDVVVEYAVLRTPLAREALRPLGAALAKRPSLTRTVAALAETGGNRSGAARVLGVHRSTVDQRIAAIEALTSLSPADPRGLALISTAVLVAGQPSSNGTRHRVFPFLTSGVLPG
jgi:hypothetical protein